MFSSFYTPDLYMCFTFQCKKAILKRMAFCDSFRLLAIS